MFDIPEQTAISAQLQTLLQKRRTMMPLLDTPYTPGHCLQTVQQLQDGDTRSIALAEYYYFSGQAAKAAAIVEPYLASDDIGLRLSACWMYAYASLTLDNIRDARRAIEQVRATMAGAADMSPQDRALAICVSNAAAILLHMQVPAGLPPMKEFIHILPPGLRLFALYVRAHEEYLCGHYWASLGIVETAHALEGETYPIPSIYLHLVAVMDYMAVKQPDQAKKHLLAAWALARPDDMIEAFGEHHGLLGGMLEAVLKKNWPEDFRRIIAITYSFSAGWRKIHNRTTGNAVASDLTTTEFSIAMLAARGWSNKEISAHLGVSANTVKLHISAALQKLCITQRKELAQYMLK